MSLNISEFARQEELLEAKESGHIPEPLDLPSRGSIDFPGARVDVGYKQVYVYKAYFELVDDGALLFIQATAKDYIPGYTLYPGLDSDLKPVAVLEYAVDIVDVDQQDHFAAMVRDICDGLGQTCAMVTRTRAETQCTCL